MEELMSEVIEELKIELELEDESDIKILALKVKNAIREVRASFNFKQYHSEEFILDEMYKHIYNIKRLATYDYEKIGAEGESSHSEKNIARVYENRNRCFTGIVPYAD